MSKYIKLKRGFDLNLKGKPQATLSSDISPDTYAIKPTDFPGVQRGKALVAEGDDVKAGTPVFFDKRMPDIMYCAPVSGEIAEIRRGERRKLLEIVILADKEREFESNSGMKERSSTVGMRTLYRLPEPGSSTWPSGCAVRESPFSEGDTIAWK